MGYNPYIRKEEHAMTNPKFTEFMQELEREAKAEGPAAVEELETFRSYFRLAREVADARKSKGLSQKQLAEKCGLNQSEISDIERGGANPTFRTLQSVARQLDLRIGLLPARPTRMAARTKTSPPHNARATGAGGRQHRRRR